MNWSVLVLSPSAHKMYKVLGFIIILLVEDSQKFAY